MITHQKTRALVHVSSKGSKDHMSVQEVESHLMGMISRVGKIKIIRTPHILHFPEKLDMRSVPTSYG